MLLSTVTSLLIILFTSNCFIVGFKSIFPSTNWINSVKLEVCVPHHIVSTSYDHTLRDIYSFDDRHEFINKRRHKLRGNSVREIPISSNQKKEPISNATSVSNVTFTSNLTLNANDYIKKPSNKLTKTNQNFKVRPNHSKSFHSSNFNSFLNFLKDLINQKDAELKPLDRKALMSSVRDWIPKVNVSEVSQLTWSIGTLRLPALSRNEEMISIIDMLIDRLSQLRYQMTADDMTLSLLGLARLGVKISTSSKVQFLSCLPNTLRHMDDQQVANCVYSLGKISVKWTGLGFKAQKCISESITRTISKMTPQGVANTILGLSNMALQWEVMPSYLKNALLESLTFSLLTMNEQEVSNCISG